jgi:hypothetical protein
MKGKNGKSLSFHPFFGAGNSNSMIIHGNPQMLRDLKTAGYQVLETQHANCQRCGNTLL